MRFRKFLPIALLILLPLATMLAVWLSSLAFVPVPWPDDSAFYFVAKDLFKWPPRWVMLPQSPFEPTYRIWNFNTMPLYPILIGLGRFVGIDGSFALKFWPLTAWAASAALFGVVLYRARAGLAVALLFTAAIAFDPALRWASVLVRPESLIGLAGVALILGLTLGFPKKLEPRGHWDPVAALLAFAAYAHFNAIHLVFAVLVAFLYNPRRLVSIGAITVFYLSPWIATVVARPKLFIHQMGTQWRRLAVPNGWLDSPRAALESLYPSMGSPEPWPELVHWASVVLWAGIFAALIFGIALPALRQFRAPKTEGALNLAPAGAWVAGSLWLWHTKPELWFIYYVHLTIWVFLGLAALSLKRRTIDGKASVALRRAVQGAFVGCTLAAVIAVGLFANVNLTQARSLSRQKSWNWDTHRRFIDCIDQQLVALEAKLNFPKPFRVWDPTFPDITVELSRRHPDWQFTRTNDFWERIPLAMLHAHQVEAVVVPETLGHAERSVSGPWKDHPEVHSVWMTWDGYFLKQLNNDSTWNRERYVCQEGRWQAFLFLKR